MASLTTVARISAPICVASRASSETTNSVRAPAASRSNTVATPRQLARVHTANARRGERLVANGRKGMLAETLDGEEGKKSKKDKKAGKFAQTQSMAASMDPKAAKRKDGYIAVGNVNTDFTEKNIKLLELANGQFLAVRWEDTGDVYVIPCASTAFSYPLIDGESILIFTRAIRLTDVVFFIITGELFFGPMGPAIRVPLDGTEYDLTTGAVITWCPGGGNPVKAVLGALKKAADPIPLKSYPVRVEADGTVTTTFTQANASEGFANKTATEEQ